MQNSDINATGGALRPARADAATAKKRLGLRDQFFRHVVEVRSLLEPFDQIPGVLYFVKDVHRRVMAVSRDSVARLGFESEEEMIGLTDRDYLPEDLAAKYRADDEWVLRNGKPMRNIVEMWLNSQGMRDWIVTDKYPVRNARNEVVGLVGTIQSLEGRRKLVAHLGPVGKAADYIREHLGDSMMVADIARHAGFSERQLQRLFRRVFGQTIQQFIIQSRVHAAIHELTHSEHTIAHIAGLFGFSDQSAFTNKFRAVTGTTPRNYRERYVAKFTA